MSTFFSSFCGPDPLLIYHLDALDSQGRTNLESYGISLNRFTKPRGNHRNQSTLNHSRQVTWNMVAENSFKRAWDYAGNHNDKFVKVLQELVNQPSISAQNVGLKECAELVRTKMAGLGFKTKIISVTEAPSVVYGELKGQRNAKTLVVYNHYDVQPVEPIEEWNSDPFKATIRNGKIFGRGVGDDKGELAARLSAIESIVNTEGSLKPNLRWIIEGEEETGSSHLHTFVKKNKELLKGDGCLWETGERSSHGTPEVHLGVKGLLYVEFRVKVGAKDQHSQYGPIAPNPAWRLVNFLKTIKDENERILIPGFYSDVAKPTTQERKFLSRNEFSTEALRRSLQIDYLFKEKSDSATVTKLLYNPTANIAGFGSGYQGMGSKTIVPKEAFVKMDFRLVADMKANDILSKLKRHLKTRGFADIKLVVHSKEDPAKTSLESYIAKIMIKAIEISEKKMPNVWPTIAGTGPLSLFTRDLSLPTAMGAGVNYPGAAFHAPNENVVLEYYRKGIKQLITLFSMF